MRNFRKIIPVVIFLTLLSGLNLYAFQAIKTLFSGSDAYGLLSAVYWFIAVVVVVIAIGGLLINREGWPSWFRIYAPPVLLSVVIGQLVVVLFLFLDDVLILGRLGFDTVKGLEVNTIHRQPVLSWTGLLFGSIPVALLLYGMVRNAYNYQLKRIDLPFKNLPESLVGLKIIQISDIHSGSLTRPKSVIKAIEMINDLNADLLFFTGDLVNFMASEMEPYIPVFKQLKAKYGVYSITGNHDYGDYVSWESEAEKAKNFESFKELHKRMGWRLLMNEHEILNINGQEIAILGIENWGASLRFPKYGDLAKAYKGTENAALRLLLSHDPSHWKAEVIPKFKDIDAMFSGHTHGFQFGIEWGKFRWSPGQYVYAEWAGLYRFANQFLYVNRGFGYTFYPGRVGILPEISLFTLRSE